PAAPAVPDTGFQFDFSSPKPTTPSTSGTVRRDGRGNPLTHDGYPAKQLADGSIMTERSITVTDPRLNEGKPTNIPSLWKGQIQSQDQAIELAAASGNQYPSFDSIDAAVKGARARSEQKGLELDQTDRTPMRAVRQRRRQPAPAPMAPSPDFRLPTPEEQTE